MSEQHWSIKSAIEQIEKCSFSCEAGPLENNEAWKWMVAASNVGPEFWPGEGVWFMVEAIAAGRTIAQWVHFYIVGCRMDSDAERRFWTYSLSYDPPAPNHYGTVHFRGIRGERLSRELPVVPEQE